MGWPRFAGSSIQRRIFSGFVVLVTLVLGMSMAGQWQLREVKQVSQELLPQGQRAHRLQELGVALWSLEADAERLMVVGDAEIRDKVRDDLAQIERTLAQLGSDTSAAATGQTALAAQVAQLRARLGRFGAQPQSVRQRNEDMLAVYGALQQAKQSLRDASLDNQRRLQQAVARQTLIIGNLTLQFLVASALVFVAALIAALFISRSIAAPVAELARAAEKVAEGQLTWRAQVSSNDEIGLLAERFNLMTARLHATLDGLRRSEADYRGIYANALEGIWRVGLDRRVLSANPAMASMLGYDSPDDLLASVTDVRRQIYLHGEERDRAVPELLRRGLLAGRELQFRCKNGQVIWVSTNTRVECDEAGNALYFEAFVTDITERKRAEQELRRHRDNLEEMVAARTAELTAAKERAEVASRAKSVFLASMSHELRTPLNAVLGYAQILQNDRALAEPQRGRVKCIEQAGEHLLMLINEVLDLAKIEAGKLELQSDDIALPRLLDMVADIARVKAEQKGLRFIRDEAAGLPGLVRGDERRLRQVLLNLLDNAVKFTERGEVVLRVRVPRPGVLHFEVEDSGCGIAADHLELIFQPFEQVGTALLKPGGTGLGLSISRQLVAKMGGQLRVASHPGQGSSFWFELPLGALERAASEAPARATIAGYAGARKRLLVVDDMLANRELLVDWLAPLGFEIDQAADGKEALACAAASPPDLVLMDCVMPVMDGPEATRRLRVTPGLEGVPVIAISAAALHDDERRSFEAGASAFVRKPIDLDALLDRIGSLLALRWLDEPGSGDTAAATPAPALVPPRHEELIVLHRLAQRGNMREIRAFAEQLADREPDMRPFAQRLLQLADAYQPTAILRLVTAHL